MKLTPLLTVRALAQKAILSIRGMSRRLSARFDALERERSKAPPRRGRVRH